jgi:hypothetical protein
MSEKVTNALINVTGKQALKMVGSKKRLSEKCPKNVRKMSEKCPKNVRKMSEKCPKKSEKVRKMSEKVTNALINVTGKQALKMVGSKKR